MVSVEELDDFTAKAVMLLRRDPCQVVITKAGRVRAHTLNSKCLQVRFVMKYRHCKGYVCCKVTDDSTARRSQRRIFFPFCSSHLTFDGCHYFSCFSFESSDVRVIRKLKEVNSMFFTTYREDNNTD